MRCRRKTTVSAFGALRPRNQNQAHAPALRSCPASSRLPRLAVVPTVVPTADVPSNRPAGRSGPDDNFRVDNPPIAAAAEAMKQIFGKETVYIRSGGSILIVGVFDRYLGIASVLMGFGLPGGNLHAPNKKFHLPSGHREMIGGLESCEEPPALRFFAGKPKAKGDRGIDWPRRSKKSSVRSADARSQSPEPQPAQCQAAPRRSIRPNGGNGQ